MVVTCFFCWRMGAWADTGDQWDGIMALVWCAVAVFLAYGIVHTSAAR